MPSETVFSWSGGQNFLNASCKMAVHFCSFVNCVAVEHKPDINLLILSWMDKKYDYYVLDYAESGNLSMQIGDNSIQHLKGPVVFLTFPGPRFRFGRYAGHWDHRFISFKGKLADSFAHSGLFSMDKPVLKISAPQRFGSSFDELLKYMAEPEHGTSRAAYMLEGLLLQLHEQPPQKVSEYSDPRILNVIKKLTARPEQSWNLQRLATQSALSYPHFRRIFIAATGMPPGNFIIVKRMEKAARILRKAFPTTLQETASLCGYDDIYHFNKSFSKFHKIPPGRYRDNFQLK